MMVAYTYMVDVGLFVAIVAELVVLHHLGPQIYLTYIPLSHYFIKVAL